jgi:dihydrofolate reductase
VITLVSGTTSPAVTLKRDLSSVLEHLPELKNEDKSVDRHFIIGGASLYRETLALPTSAAAHVNRVLLTRILSPAFDECDVFMPDFLAEDKWKRASHAELESWVGFEVAAGVQEENGVQYEFQMWIR